MFGDNLKQHRIAKGLSQSELAEKMFVSRQCISKWENDVTQPDLQSLKLLGEILEVSIDELLLGISVDKSWRTKYLNRTLFALNILVALFCLLCYTAVWRFLPQIIPAHWSENGIDRYGSRNEIFLNFLTVFVFLSTDIVLFFGLRRIADKKVFFISHGIVAFFQIAMTVFIVAMYAKYLTHVICFVSCISTALLLCLSIAMDPKITKRNFLFGIRNAETLSSPAIWNRINALGSYIFSAASLALYIAFMLWLNIYALSLFAIYVPLTLVLIIYSKKLAKTGE